MWIHQRLRHALTIIPFLIILLTVIEFHDFHNVIAANIDSSTTNHDYETALKTTPQGLKWANDDFIKADFPGNQAEIVGSKNPTNPDTSIIKMTNSTYQVGGVWGNQNKDNYFDISHEQVASMWLYFGNTGDVPGDGMAFVLHNDSRGLKTIAWKDGKAANGQSLGVWGADWDWNQTNPQILADSAIQNSWALEFDTFNNNLTTYDTISGEGVSFDSSYPTFGQHIAYNYPGDANTYIRSLQVYEPGGNKTKYYYRLKHNGFNGNLNIVNSTWHHVTIKWTPSETTKDGIPDSGTLEYRFNDKNSNGTPNNGNDRLDVSADVDTSHFHLNSPDTKKTPNTRLYWGFTGSTGKYFENNLIVFESIPSFVDAEAKPAIYDDSQNGREIKEKDKNVDPNDNVRYTYSLNYKGWSKTWNNIKSLMNVPANIHFTSGTVTYPDSPHDTNPHKLPDDIFNNNPKQIIYTLPEQLDSHSRNAVIELKGTTSKIATSSLIVPSAHASFRGDNLITDTNTAAFTIRPRLLVLDSSSPNPIKISATNQSVDVPGHISYVGNGNLDFKNLVVHQKLNGKAVSLLDGKIGSDGNFHLKIPRNDLGQINLLEFHVTDANGNTSNIISRQIQVGGTLSFGAVSDEISFKSSNDSLKKRIINRDGHWIIEINDSREKGNSWHVQAQASDLTLNNTNTKLNGHIFYRSPDGKDTPLKDNITVASHTKYLDSTENKNITDSWTSQNGILLSMDPNNSKGKYTGTINWTLLDSLSNA